MKKASSKTVSQPRPGSGRDAVDFVTIGECVGAFGLDGTLKVRVLTDFLERFDKGQYVYIRGTKYRVEKTFWHKLQARVKLKGINSIEECEALVGAVIEVPMSERPELYEDEFYAADLLGLKVVLEDGTQVGVVAEVVNAPAQDLLRIGKSLVPMVKQFVKEIDLKKKVIVLTPIEGLLED